MKQVCLLCDRTALDHNLYCQEVYCPAEISPTILSYGKWLGDIEIVRPVMILRTSVLYEAWHNKQKVFVKIAHAGTNNTNRLKREADFLKQLRLEKKPHPSLPVWMPPHADQGISKETVAYGRAVLGDQLLYYYITEFVAGEPLRDVITKVPQLWINHVGWIMTRLTSAVAFLQSRAQFHFALSPDSILMNFQNDTTVPKVFLFDLGVSCEPKNLKTDWYSDIVPPAYKAPELMSMPITQASYATDTYGLGLIFYELLVGQPCYGYKLLSDSQVEEKVRQNQHIRMNRLEDVEPIARMALKAVDMNVTQRYPDAATMAAELLTFFGNEPKQRSRWIPTGQTTLKIIVSLLAIAFLITFVITLRQLNVF